MINNTLLTIEQCQSQFIQYQWIIFIILGLLIIFIIIMFKYFERRERGK